MAENEEQLSKKERRAQKRAEKAERKAEEARQEKRDAFVQNIFMWGFMALLGAGLVVFVSSVLGNEAPIQEIVVEGDERIKGNPDASVTLVEYGDFQCPACGAAHPYVQGIVDQYGEDMRLVYRHFPLAGHSNAYVASRAAEAAGEQGAFFEMHDMLFENQGEWSSAGNAEEVFRGYAQELGLDIEAYEEAFASDEVKGRIDEDLTSGGQLGVNSTPTFFLNGRRVQFSRYDQLEQMVADAITEAESGTEEVEEGIENEEEQPEQVETSEEASE